MKVKEMGYTKEELLNMADTYLAEPARRWDFIEEQGDGMYVYDEEGNQYLDFFAGIAVSSTGNCNKKVSDAIATQCRQVIHASNYAYTMPMLLLAKKVCDTIGMEKIVFQNSGTEANEAMIKMARKYGTDNYGPERYHIVTAKNSFHGRTYGALSATGQPDNACQNGFKPMLPGFSYAEYNNLEDFKSKCTENTIAIMVEPVQGEGGVYPATKEFLQGLRDYCDENDMLLLYDEVQTGWGRTGDIMAYMEYGVKPDMVSMAKAIGGGMPIGAMCTSAKIAKTFSAGAHGSTYAANPVCCSAALAEIEEILNNNLAANAKEVGAYFMEQLKKLPYVKEIRGKGLLVGVEFEKPIAFEVKHKAMENKLLITAVRESIIRLAPPLIATKEDCDKAVELLIKSVNEAISE
ncbi:MAG: aspartate aminotransferase family protein [Coprococcus sp.]